MDIEKMISGKRVLLVDDEKDILDTLTDLLEICKIDAVLSFEEAKAMLEQNDYDVAVLDIMGVKGYELLQMTTDRKIPTIMLTANALTKEDLKKSAEEGAVYYAPKDRIDDIPAIVAEVLEAIESRKSTWQRMFDRMGSFYDQKFGGPDWREKEKSFWEKKMRQIPYL